MKLVNKPLPAEGRRRSSDPDRDGPGVPQLHAVQPQKRYDVLKVYLYVSREFKDGCGSGPSH